jgi:DNA-binding response OmpR family regulator
VDLDLRRSNFTTFGWTDGDDVLEKISQYKPAILLLDISVSGNVYGIDALTLCGQISDNPDTNNILIILTTKELSEPLTITALDWGADEILLKPYGRQLLLAKIKALSRGRKRGRNNEERENILVSGDLSIDLVAHRVTKDGEEIAFTLQEFKLLCKLMRNIGVAFNRFDILSNGWGYSTFIDARTVDRLISNLRKKIEQDPTNPTRIETVIGFGYRFNG